jgi:serine protease inhibitor
MDLAAAVNAFGFDLYRRMASSGGRLVEHGRRRSPVQPGLSEAEQTGSAGRHPPMKRTIALSVILSLVFTSACTTSATPGPTASAGTRTGDQDVIISAVARTTPSADQATAAAAAINAFGMNLYQKVAAGGGTANVVFSPASIALALAMTRPGARGTTAAQLDAVLHGLAGGTAGTDPINALDQALAARSGTFDTAYGPRTVALRIANAPFGQRGETFEQAYLDALASGFGAGLRLVDYKANTDAARRTINAWVADQTANRIPELLGLGVLTADSRLTLVNAIYLKAAWANHFADKESSTPLPFHRADGTSVDVPMMWGGGHLQYAAGTGWQAVELPYVGDQLAMLVIAPDSLADFEKSFDAASLGAIVNGLYERTVDLRLPRFSTETKTDVASTLSAMGMPDAFDPDKADFSGITAQDKLYISAVIHQANIDVDENGTEAAAATAVVMAAGAAAPATPEVPVKMTVDRPFIFALRDRTTGAVLFLGRIGDPSVGR